MQRIASTHDLRTALYQILALTEQPNPSRQDLADHLRRLAFELEADYTPMFMHSKIKDEKGKVKDSKDGWLPKWGKPGAGTLKKVVEQYEKAHPGETVIEAEVRTQGGDVKAKYKS